MARKSKKIHQNFESRHDNGKFTKICDDMIQSKAWKQLTVSQIGLYFILKTKFTRHKDGTYNTLDISMPRSEWSQMYGRKTTFDKDIDALIEYGFIKVVLYRGNQRECTIYGFSDKWQLYGQDLFKIHPYERRPKDTLSEEHKKAIGKKAKETNAKRYGKGDSKGECKIISL